MHRQQDLIDAIKNGDDGRLSQLLEPLGEEQLFSATITDPRPTNHAIGFGMTLLQFASFRSWKEGNPASVLVNHGAVVDFHSACGLGMKERMLEVLAADPGAISRQVDGYFPIQFAISASQPSSILTLVEHGDDLDRSLRKVAYFGWEDEIGSQEYLPWKPLHMAALWGFDAARVPVAQALADSGADLNAASPLDGYLPIHLVAMSNRVDMIRFFVSQGADVNSRTVECDEIRLSNENAGPVGGHRCTPLMIASGEGFVEAAACLLELGADRQAVNDRGQTALDFANSRFWKGQPYDKVLDLLMS